MKEGADSKDSTDVVLSRDAVYDFLVRLEKHFQSTLPERKTVASQVTRLLDKTSHYSEISKVWSGKPEGPESAFLGEYILPGLEDFLLQRHNEMPSGTDSLSIICAGFAVPKRYTKRINNEGHPFSKEIRKAETIYSRWKDNKIALTQPYPDFSLLAPYRILFEGKYFRTNLKSPARIQLVKDLYETFFYRALPEFPARMRYPEWNYPYACYLAYDASDGGQLLKAWSDLPDIVRKSFWKQANIFVMILAQPL
jgi:hypothetical protein